MIEGLDERRAAVLRVAMSRHPSIHSALTDPAVYEGSEIR